MVIVHVIIVISAVAVKSRQAMSGMTKLKLFLCLLLIATVFVPSGTTEHQLETQSVYFLTILPYPDPTATVQPAWDAGPHLLPAAELAVELINNRTGLLEGYHLELISDDGGCNIVVKTVTSFVRQVLVQQSHQPVVGVIGGGCSDSSLALSPLFAREEVSLIHMHLGGSPLLENRILYPNTFGAAGSSHFIVDTIFALMNLNSWQRIAVLYDESTVYLVSTFLELKHNIKRAVPGGEITFSSAVYPTEFPLAAIRESFTRVIVAATPPELARRIMCLAYHEQMLFPAFQWILLLRELVDFTGMDTIFYYNGRRYVCSTELMASIALQGNLMIIYRLSALDPSSTTVAGISYDEYLSMYKERIDQYNREGSNLYRPLSPNIWATVVFDEVWALALALNNSNLDLSKYQNGRKEMTSVIRKEVYKLDFEGISGYIRFDNATGFSTRGADIFQVIGARQEHVASYDGRSIVSFGSGEFISDQFQTSVVTVSGLAVGVFTMVTLILLCLIVGVHVATFKYREHSAIKASSPLLNQLIYTGCYIFVVGTLLYYLYVGTPLSDEVAGNVCHAVWVWIIPVGYTLIVGTIIARTWRLYRLFAHTFNPGRLISNPLLFMFVFVLLSVCVVIEVTWTIIDPLKMEVISQTVVAEEMEMEYQVVKRRVCRGSRYFYIWVGIAFTYLTFLMIAMIALSLLTLKIQRKNFTTKALRVLAYLLGLVFLICIPVLGITFWSDVDIHIPYVTLSFLLNSVIFLCFALVFLPQILTLLKERYQLIRMLFDHIDNS